MNYTNSLKAEKEDNLLNRYEKIVIITIAMVIFLITLLPIRKVISIWNQNDEFGVWQGAAWLLNLDWSEVTSSNGYYGYGYGFLLFPFLKFLGDNIALMTKVATGFQALMHAITVIIAWVCAKKLFPDIPSVDRIVGAALCSVTVPDLFYINVFFSECILRVLVWLIFLCIVYYSTSGKIRYNVLANLLSIYAFSIHQRCILLLGISFAILMFSVIYSFMHEHKKWAVALKSLASLTCIFLFYFGEYKMLQELYIQKMYSASSSEGIGGNLLSERHYSLEYLLKDIFFNADAEKIAVQNMLGNYYYVFAISFGLIGIGAVCCFIYIIRNYKAGKWRDIIPYFFVFCSVLGGILLVVYQYANEYVYTRVELMHYGRYSSYLYAPMILIGVLSLFSLPVKQSVKIILSTTLAFIVSGISTSNVLEKNNVTNLFAFPNACPGIRSVYFTDTAYNATQYHTVVGVAQTLCIVLLLFLLNNSAQRIRTYIKIIFMVVVSSIWFYTANSEWEKTRYSHSNDVEQTYDLNKILSQETDFIIYKSNLYGGGLFQYNNPKQKIHIRNDMSEFMESDSGLLVVSKKELIDINEIDNKYEIVYQNPIYIVWLYG